MIKVLSIKRKKILLIALIGILCVSIGIAMFAFFGKKTNSAQNNVVADIKNEQATVSPTAKDIASVPAAAAPKLSVEEVKVVKEEQKKVAESAKKEEVVAEKAVAAKVVTSSVVKSVPIPEGFPVTNVPIIQGAQITAASKNGNIYNMTIRVNVPAKDSYKYYYDLYDAIGSAKIASKTENKALTVNMSKKGLGMEFSFANDGDNASMVTMKVTETQ